MDYKVGIYRQIRLDMLQSKKSKDYKTYVILKELYMDNLYLKGFMSDQEVIDFIKIYVDGKSDYCKTVVEAYIPCHMDEMELRYTIGRLFLQYDKRDASCIGKVMMDLKTRYAGRFDGKMASNIIKNEIQP